MINNILKKAAYLVAAIPVTDRNAAVLRSVKKELDTTLPKGWEGSVNSNSVAAFTRQMPATEPVWVRRKVIFLDSDFAIKETGYWKYPDGCCIWCGTDLGTATGEDCPTCGGN
ncbi:hypothetical protein BR63_03385 [Thermanaerosceptrum fracticalcis]|jgi:hypothetical protein|uniref:Uncharacterized protein n=1 Tax=Thermanaerosceptrum fracticalcis TaxID=1712410 RepID=A0A7G6E039_THEFR|nr:hypothetical protein [Thermanaerosceptrum fracticalcis]QNB45443.1 hypothetical protein BR63_03385 [Thermanaerosceptrum fracticalcis]